jgi:hypothetical protein
MTNLMVAACRRSDICHAEGVRGGTTWRVPVPGILGGMLTTQAPGTAVVLIPVTGAVFRRDASRA